MDASLEFVRNFQSVRYEDIPPAVVEITKHEILDTLGVAMSGRDQPAARQVLEMVSEWGGKGESTIIGSPLKVPAPNAAQVNATMAHARDYDDVHETAVMHPGIITITTAFAAAELVGGISGKALITAIALGVDMICRLALASRPGVSAIHTGWHYTSLYGYPTAALTAGLILGLDEEQMVSAFGIAYHQCAGNGQTVTDGTLSKRLGPGFAVRGGLTAALMAAKGVTGARNSLEGEAGLFKIYHQGQYDRDLLLHDLGRHFEGINVSMKPYPCCRGIHASIDAALQLVAKDPIAMADVKEIVLTTGEANHRLLCTPHDVKVRPRNPVDAQFSIPWGVATALSKRQVGVDDYSAKAVADPATLAVAAKVRTQVDHALDSARGVEPARLNVVMTSGETLSARIDLAKGSPGQPMTFEDCVAKFRDCVSLANMPHDKVDQAIAFTAALEAQPDGCGLIKVFA